MKTLTILSLAIIVLCGCGEEKTSPRPDSSAVITKTIKQPLSIKDGFLELRWGERPSVESEFEMMKDRHAAYDEYDTNNFESRFTGGSYLGLPVDNWLFFRSKHDEQLKRVLIWFKSSPDVGILEPCKLLQDKLKMFLGIPFYQHMSFDDPQPNDPTEEDKDFGSNKAAALTEWVIPRKKDSILVKLGIDNDIPEPFMAVGPTSNSPIELTHQDSLDFRP